MGKLIVYWKDREHPHNHRYFVRTGHLGGVSSARIDNATRMDKAAADEYLAHWATEEPYAGVREFWTIHVLEDRT